MHMRQYSAAAAAYARARALDSPLEAQLLGWMTAAQALAYGMGVAEMPSVAAARS
jgi:hypothetical protein